MIRIGLVDNYIDEWHARNLVKRYRELAAEVGIECEISGFYALVDDPKMDGFTDSKTFEAQYGVPHFTSFTELDAVSDAFIIFAPDDPQVHPELAALVLPSKKPTFIDKTFASTVKEAMDIFAIAEKHGTPMYSTSSLRYATEVVEQIGKKSISVSGNYVHMKDYLVHTGEMLVTILGDGEFSITCHTDGTTYTFSVDYTDGRHADVEMSPTSTFTVNGKEVESDFFGGQIKDIIRFCGGSPSPVTKAQTLTVARFVEGGMTASLNPGTTVNT
ncbi:MAG: Gfo/Idh/MocA family oxidoreductase [Clostridia bacterium]|nr:Gfo/Idh/MocA family oxidoreductase [Clostridia bacterium]